MPEEEIKDNPALKIENELIISSTLLKPVTHEQFFLDKRH